jgi:hypothetical protein
MGMLKSVVAVAAIVTALTSSAATQDGVTDQAL